jgi:hypothetical protein
LDAEYFACALGIVVERASLEEKGVMEREAIGDEGDGHREERHMLLNEM